jgi:hypothetical protein
MSKSSLSTHGNIVKGISIFFARRDSTLDFPCYCIPPATLPFSLRSAIVMLQCVGSVLKFSPTRILFGKLLNVENAIKLMYTLNFLLLATLAVTVMFFSG